MGVQVITPKAIIPNVVVAIRGEFRMSKGIHLTAYLIMIVLLLVWTKWPGVCHQHTRVLMDLRLLLMMRFLRSMSIVFGNAQQLQQSSHLFATLLLMSRTNIIIMKATICAVLNGAFSALRIRIFCSRTIFVITFGI